MSFTRSVSVSFAAALCLSTALVMGGCSSKDEGPSATKSSPANPLGLKGPSEKTFAKHFAVPKRKVSDAEAQEALALLSLGESSTSGLSWDKTSGSDGNYSYSGLVVKDGSNSLNIKSANLIGVHMDGETASFDRAAMGAMGSFNPLAKVYDTMAMDDFSFDSDFVSVEAKGFEGKATEKGGVTTIRQVSEPFVIKLKDDPKDASAKRAFDTIRSLEFDELVFQSSQTTVLDANKDTVELKDGLFTMKDGFKLSYNYGATGVKAMTDQMAAMGNSGSGQQMSAAMEMLKLNGMQLRLEDDSIVDRSLKLAAEMRGGTPMIAG